MSKTNRRAFLGALAASGATLTATQLAAHPELVTFRCYSCQHVQTQESQGQD